MSDEPEFWEPPEDDRPVFFAGDRSWALAMAFTQAQRAQDLAKVTTLSPAAKIENARALAQTYAFIAIADALESRD